MNLNQRYNKSLEQLDSYCKLLSDKENLQFVKTGKDRMRCFAIVEGSRWIPIEKLAEKMKLLLRDLRKEFREMEDDLKES